MIKSYLVMKLCLLVLLPVRLNAQQTPASQPSEARQAVRETVETFLDDLGRMDIQAIEQHLTPKMVLLIVAIRGDIPVNRFITREEWLASLKRNNTPFQEPIRNVHITIDSDALAYMRADFQVIQDDRVLSHGVDHFTLVREDGRWKIAAVAFTSIPGAPGE